MGSVFAGNGRVANTARWLREKPEGAYELVLVMADGDGSWEVVQRWPEARCVPELASEIEETIADYLEEVRQTCAGSLRFVDDEERVISSRKLRCRFDGGDSTNPFGSDHLRFEGNAQSVLAQTQAHQQAFVRTFVDMVKFTQQSALDRVQEAAEERATMKAELDRLTAENRELQEALLLAENETEDASVKFMEEGVGLLKLAAMKSSLAKPGASKPDSDTGKASGE